MRAGTVPVTLWKKFMHKEIEALSFAKYTGIIFTMYCKTSLMLTLFVDKVIDSFSGKQADAGQFDLAEMLPWTQDLGEQVEDWEEVESKQTEMW